MLLPRVVTLLQLIVAPAKLTPPPKAELPPTSRLALIVESVIVPKSSPDEHIAPPSKVPLAITRLPLRVLLSTSMLPRIVSNPVQSRGTSSSVHK